MNYGLLKFSRCSSRKGWLPGTLPVLSLLLSLVLLSSFSLASTGLTVFGPKRYIRHKGEPTTYTDTFKGCNDNGQAVLHVINGNRDSTRITSAEIFVNGTKVAKENEFKKDIASFDKVISLRQTNTLQVKLKGGHQDEHDNEGHDGYYDDDGREDNGGDDDDNHHRNHPPSFLIIEVIAQGCGSNSPPVISNPRPADNSLLRNTVPAISAQYAAASNGAAIDVASVLLSVDGTDVTLSSTISATSISYTPATSLSEGIHPVTVSVSDLQHNSSSLTWHFTTDTVAPAIKITSQQNNQHLSTPSIIVSGTLSDPTATVAVNGHVAQVSGSTFSYSGLSLSEGPNTITVSAVDPAGNIGTDSIVVNLDTVPPVVQITAPQQNAIVSTPSITVNGTVNEAITSVYVNNTLATISGNRYSASSISLVEGVNTITVSAVDEAGNSGMATVTVNLDTAPPVVQITAPHTNAILNIPMITVTGTVNEPVSSVTVNGIMAIVTETSFSLSGLMLGEGTNTISVQATDEAGNIGTASITVLIDTFVPTIQITSPRQNDYLNTSHVIVSGTVSEPVISLTINGIPAIITGNGFNLSGVALTEGTNTIVVQAVDQAGNIGTNSVTVNLDTVLPQIQMLSPQSSAFVNKAAITVAGNVAELHPAGLWINETPVLLTNGSFSLVIQLPAEGGNSITVRATDLANNTSIITIPITLDTIAPDTTITSGPAVITNLKTASFSFLSTEPNSTFECQLDNGVFAACTSPKSYASLADGAHTFLVKSTDTAGNTDQSPATFIWTVDTVLPDITITSPGADMYLNTPHITVTGMVSKTPASVTVNNVPARIVENGFILTDFALTEGLNTLLVEVVDAAGNRGSKSIKINLDTISPVVQISGPQANAIINTPVIAVNGTVSEENVSVTVNGIPASTSGQNYSITTLTLTEGTNTLQVEAKDRAGNIGIASISITLDTVPPVAGITQVPQSPTRETGATLAAGGADVVAYKYKLDNSAYSPEISVPVLITLSNLAEGSHGVSVIGRDIAGNWQHETNATTATWIVDLIRPVLNVSALTDGAFTNNSVLNIAGTATDSIGLQNVIINNVPVAISSDGTFNQAIMLVVGSNKITTTASDQAGNQTTDIRNITLDMTAPQLVITSPADNSVTNVANAMVTGSVDETATVSMKINNGEVQPASIIGNTWNVTAMLVYGQNTVEVLATDRAGNTTTDKRTVTYDNINPTLAVTNPAQDMVTNLSSITLEGTVTDLTSPTVTVMLDGATYTPVATNGIFQQTLAFVAEKTYTIIVTATDAAGNSATVQRNIMYDKTPPVVAIDPVTTPTNVNSQSIKGTMEAGALVNVTCPTAAVGVVTYPTINTWQAVLTNMIEGNIQISVAAVDAAGNTSQPQTASIILDTMAPDTTITSGPAVITNVNTAGFTFSSTELGSTFECQLDNGAFSACASPMSYTNLMDGAHTFMVKATDVANNSDPTPAAYTWTVDTIAPSVQISVPQAEAYLNTSSITVTGTTTEAVASVTVNGSPAIITGMGFSFPNLSLAEGVNTVSVSATDLAGNISTKTINITLDTVPPVIQVSAPQVNTILNTPLITVSGNIIDANLASLWINETETQLAGQSFSRTNVALTEGQSTISLRASDRAGNESTIYVPVTLDTIPPVVAITTPAPGALVKTQTVTVSGTVSEQNSTVLVNNMAAQVIGQDFTLAGISLLEGLNTISVKATDRAGNSGNANINITLDNIAPVAPVIIALPTPSPTPIVTISGTAEAGSLITLSMQAGQSAASVVGIATASTQGTFSIANITLAEGTSTFSATAMDVVGNTSPISAPVSVERDTKPPVITVSSPANNSFKNQGTITVVGTINEQGTVSINGATVALDGLNFSHSVALTSSTNFIVISARDLSGNTATLNWVVYLDQTLPIVTITTPADGFLTRTSPITVSGTISETNSTASVNGIPATVSSKNFNLSNFTLVEGQNVLTVSATDRAGNIGTASVNVTLDTQSPVVTVTAPAQAAAGSAITISTSATDNRGLSLSELSVNNVTVWSFTPNSELSTQNSFAYSISADAITGSVLIIAARAIDTAGNIGTATTQIQITSGPTGPGYIQGEVYDDTKGLVLPGATVDFVATDGHGLTRTMTLEDGSFFTEAAADTYLITLSKSGFTNVERAVTVKSEKDALAIDARLTPVSTQQNLIDSNGGMIKTGASSQGQGVGTSNSVPSTQYIELNIPAYTLTEQTDIRLTPISNQGLAGLLPIGWSPIAIVDIRAFATEGTELTEKGFGTGAALRMPVLTGLNLVASSAISLAKYDTTAHQWIVQTPGIVSSDSAFINASIPSIGQYAFVLSDPGPLALAPILSGSPLSALNSTLGTLNSSLTATGRVVPAVAPAAIGVKAIGEVILSAPTTTINSGIIVNAKVTERFDLLSGEVVLPSDYVQDLVMYRYPCMTNLGLSSMGQGSGGLTSPTSAVKTTFPITPSHDYTIIDLMKGKVGVEVSLRQGSDGSGTMVGAEGARLLDKDGNVLVIPQNGLTKTVPIETKTIAASTLTGVVGSDFTLLRAVDVNLSNQTLTGSAELSIPAPANVSASLPIVVARAIEIKGVKKLKLVALAKLSGSLVTTLTTGPLLLATGINVSGQYFFLQAKSALGFASGVVKDGAAKTYASAQVASSTCSLVDLTSADGKYLVASTISNFTLTASDIYKNDKGQRVSMITTANQVVILDVTINVTPPFVVSIVPADNALGIDPKTQVVITMSEAVKPESVTVNTVILKDATGTQVTGVYSLSPDGTVITSYPETNLKSETQYGFTITRSIQDLQGYFMGQDFVSHFTIKDTTPPPMPAAGSIVSSFPDVDGYVTITATQGSAEATGAVLIINDTSGEVLTVAPASNGSFTGRIMAQLGDEIKILSMDSSGNQTLITYITFKSNDGHYLVTAKGGIVEGEGGTRLEIPEGALLGPTIIKITPVLETDLPQDNPVPTQAQFLAGVKIDTGGAGFQKEVQFSVQKPANMPTEAMPFVARPIVHTWADGTQENVYEIRDSAKVVGNRLTTACLPYPGIVDDAIYVILHPRSLTGEVTFAGYTYRDMDGLSGYLPGTDKPIEGAVIRAPGAENFISYSDKDGHYAAIGFTAHDVCRSFIITAIHPQTMNRITVNLVSCDAPYIVNNFNFKLADKDTQYPDKTPPIISIDMRIAPGQSQEKKFMAGTVPVDTEIEVPIRILDQQLAQPGVTLGIVYQAAMVRTNYPVTVSPTGLPTIVTRITPTSPDKQVPIYAYTYNANFRSPIVGSSAIRFKPKQAGTYQLNLEATDAAGNKSAKSLTVRAVNDGTQAVGLDGPPTVNEIIPGDGAEEIMVTMPVTIIFNEPVSNVTGTTVMLLDLGPIEAATGLVSSQPFVPVSVPSVITTNLEGSGERVTLTPVNNLMLGRQYRIVITTKITDAVSNSFDFCNANIPPLSDGCLLPLKIEYMAEFKTKQPEVFDLQGDQFTSGRGIDLYYDQVNDKTYAYVTAGSEGWYVIDVTDPINPEVVKTHKMTTAGVNWDDRGVAVDPQTSMLAITENIQYNGGNQYGYVRFYDLTNNPQATPALTPADPRVVAREKMAEAYSGIPGRLSLQNNFAFVATVGVGLQVIDIKAAKDFMQKGKDADGSSIVGIFDTNGLGYRQPTDIVAYKGKKALLTTTSGHLITLDLSIPQLPQQMAAYKPATADASNYYYDSAWRVAVIPEYAFTDTSQGADMASTKVIDLAVTTSMLGRIHTVDVTDPYNPTPMGVTKDKQGAEVLIAATDITLNKTSGLVFVTAGNAIYVIDIKDPNNPVLLNTITTTPAQLGGGIPTQLGNSPALVEKDGYLYLANQQKGMRVLGLDSRELGIEADKEYNTVLIPPTDYYPALGTKTLTINGVANGVALDSDWGLYLAAQPINSNVQIGGSVDDQGNLLSPVTGPAFISYFTANNGLKKGFAPLYIRWDGVVDPSNDYFTIRLQARKIGSTAQNELTATKVYDFTFRMRHNGNVLFSEVRDGQAAFVSDCVVSGGTTTCRTPGVTAAGTSDDENKKFDYVQELVNQVIPRGRTVWKESLSSGETGTWVPTDANYNLIEEDGIYSQATASAVRLFRLSYNMASNSTWRLGNTNVNFIGDTNGNVNYKDDDPDVTIDGLNDNTTDTFRKLMKDYNHRKTVQASKDWLNKIVDKETLIGTNLLVAAPTAIVTGGNADIELNRASNKHDTGLYELYKNVVKRFVNQMIEEADRYRLYQSKTWYARDGSTILGPGIENGSGVSYCYGCRGKLEDFSSVTSCVPMTSTETKGYYTFVNGAWVPHNGKKDTIATATTVDANYKANVNSTGCNLTGTEKYPGLYQWEWRVRGEAPAIYKTDTYERVEFSQLMPKNWAGIDCSGLVTRAMQSSLETLKNGSEYFIQLAPIWSGSLIQFNQDAAAENWASDTFFRTSVKSDQGEKLMVHYLSDKSADTISKLHKGDLIQYNGHVSIVYSDKTTCKDKTDASTCAYDIIHAYGWDTYQPLSDNGKKDGQPVFSRKVIKTKQKITAMPTGFGRIKLWD